MYNTVPYFNIRADQIKKRNQGEDEQKLERKENKVSRAK